MMAVEIKQTLEREFEVFLTAHDIRSLNFAKLQELSNKNRETEKKNTSDTVNSEETIEGIKVLVRVIGSEDINPEICIPLNEDLQTEKPDTFFIPGIEGIGNVFESLAPKIKSPSFCLQFGTTDDGQDSIDALASKLLPVIIILHIFYVTSD